jgi:hypothetical protein
MVDTKIVRRALVLIVFLAALAAVPTASARVNLGLYGDLDRFQTLTGQRTMSGHMFVGWNKRTLDNWFPVLGPMPIFALHTSLKGVEMITPRGIARGRGDDHLMKLNTEIAAWGKPVYIRPLAEMNHHHNVYCAYNENGTRRDRAHSTYWFRRAFRRMYLILHGGSKDVINAKLARHGLPGVARDLAANPYPRLRVIWNPQGFGSPDVPGNSAQAYYPGDPFVDVVGNDLYFVRGKAMWAAADALYDAHPTKRYAFPEWGLWGVDDPTFIRRMASFVQNHPRIEMIAYYNGEVGSFFDLGSKPLSRRAYRATIVPLGG